uniref:ribose-phosphate diphosphokinase n=1 Tax=Myxobolus squamalis TaxID=59785 RepID=A0A6B2FXL3_MYXSQ
MLMAAGTDHIITMDLHASQIQGFFDIPVDNLIAEPLFIEWIKGNVPNYRSAILISPDAGGVKRVASIADFLQVEFALIHKERLVANQVSNMIIVGNVAGKDVILIDDMADTCGTVIKAAERYFLQIIFRLKEAGAKKIFVMCVHGIFSGDAIEQLKTSQIDSIVVTNTIYNKENLDRLAQIKNLHVNQFLYNSRQLILVLFYLRLYVARRATNQSHFFSKIS